MKEIYLTCVGDYEWSIDSAWSTKEKAEEVAELIGGYVNTYKIDAPVYPKGIIFHFTFNPEGELDGEYRDTTSENPAELWESEKNCNFEGGFVYIEVRGKDRDVAFKKAFSMFKKHKKSKK